MAKASGGTRSGRASSFVASATVISSKDKTRILSKSFKNLSQAEDWLDKVGAKFSNPGGTGFATWGAVDKVAKSGAVEYDVSLPRDFAKQFGLKDAKEFKSGYK